MLLVKGALHARKVTTAIPQTDAAARHNMQPSC